MGKSMLNQADQYFLDFLQIKNTPLLSCLVVKGNYSKPVIHILPGQNHFLSQEILILYYSNLSV